jgi:hypothetical protein
VKLIACYENYDGAGSHAIVLESGTKNLAMQVKAFKAAGRNDLHLKITWAKEVIAGLQCIHEEHHVWTDIKVENYVNF